MKAALGRADQLEQLGGRTVERFLVKTQHYHLERWIIAAMTFLEFGGSVVKA
jgi:hypothetical protein